MFRFGVIDYIIFVSFFLVSLGIGVYFAYVGRHGNSAENYLMGGRQLGLMPVVISLVVSIISSNGLLGNAAEVGIFLCKAIK